APAAADPRVDPEAPTAWTLGPAPRSPAPRADPPPAVVMRAAGLLEPRPASAARGRAPPSAAAWRRVPSAGFWRAQAAPTGGAFSDKYQAARPRRAFSPPPREAPGGEEAPPSAAGPGGGGSAASHAASVGQEDPFWPEGPSGGVPGAGQWAGSPALVLRKGLARGVTT
ncbi:unnamed protein product, partial [Prorocentrum cordatum]